MKITDTQQSVLDRLKNEVKIPAVYESTFPAGKSPERDPISGAMYPYVIVTFGGRAPVASRSKGIVQSKFDLKWSSIGVECVAETPRSAHNLAQVVRELLESWAPTDAGELEEQLSGDAARQPEADLQPTRYVVPIVFNAQTNVTVNYA